MLLIVCQGNTLVAIICIENAAKVKKYGKSLVTWSGCDLIVVLKQ